MRASQSSPRGEGCSHTFALSGKSSECRIIAVVIVIRCSQIVTACEIVISEILTNRSEGVKCAQVIIVVLRGFCCRNTTYQTALDTGNLSRGVAGFRAKSIIIGDNECFISTPVTVTPQREGGGIS